MGINLTNNNKTREDRLSFQQKALKPKVLKRLPSRRDGSEGDIMLGHTADGYKIFAKINNSWVTFAPEDKKKMGQMHVINGGFDMASGSGEVYIPLSQGVTETTDPANYLEDVVFVVPYNCNVRRIIFRSEDAGGSCSVKLYKAIDGTQIPTTLIETVTGTMTVDDTSYVFDFTGAKIYEGEAIAISINPGATLNETIFTLVLEYDI
jgi:hypothetical protein